MTTTTSKHIPEMARFQREALFAMAEYRKTMWRTALRKNNGQSGRVCGDSDAHKILPLSAIFQSFIFSAPCCRAVSRLYLFNWGRIRGVDVYICTHTWSSIGKGIDCFKSGSPLSFACGSFFWNEWIWSAKRVNYGWLRSSVSSISSWFISLLSFTYFSFQFCFKRLKKRVSDHNQPK